MSAIVKIKPGRHKPIVNQHPWIFSGAIGSVRGNPGPGDIVTVVTSDDKFLGRGYWNEASQIQVRLLTFRDEEIDYDWWHRTLKQAIDARAHLAATTNAYRIVNGENDFIPGLVVDRYGDWLVIQALTLGIDVCKWQIGEILNELLAPRGLFERSDVDVREREGLEQSTSVLIGEVPPALIEINEGPRILVDVHNGHKTGFYLDQRMNRRIALELAERRAGDYALLNLFSYTGGFALHALQAHNVHATNLDASADALAIARKNVELNGYGEDRVDYVQADAFQWLREAVQRGEKYDLVVLDPPKFAQNKRQVEGACRGYKDLNLSAFRLTKPGGYVMTYSCSGAISADLFQKVVFGALADSGRQGQIVRHLGPGEDHPVALTFPEGAYLKGLLVRVI
ncbi:MAG: class I SAM-dependent rRNA methyltransferase [Pseudomonadota bacterium]